MATCVLNDSLFIRYTCILRIILVRTVLSIFVSSPRLNFYFVTFHFFHLKILVRIKQMVIIFI